MNNFKDLDNLDKLADFSIDDLTIDIKFKDNIEQFNEWLSSSHKCRVFLICLKIRKEITSKNMTDIFTRLGIRIDRNQIRSYLLDLCDFGVLYKGKENQKTLLFHINMDELIRNNLKELIALAKKQIGIK